MADYWTREERERFGLAVDDVSNGVDLFLTQQQGRRILATVDALEASLKWALDVISAQRILTAALLPEYDRARALLAAPEGKP
jgi:hypothetical protein